MILMQFFVVPLSTLAVTVPADGSPGNIIPNCNQEVWGAGHTPVSEIGHFKDACDFEDFLQLLRNVIRFIAMYLTAPAIVIAITYVGFLLMVSGADTGKRKEAKDVFLKVILGLVAIIGAWLIIETIYTSLGYGGFLQFN